MPQDTRDKIVNALIELAEQNPEKSYFTFSEIAKQAGLSRQAIYKKHFSNVEEIIEYIRETIMSPFLPLYESYKGEEKTNPIVFFSQHMIPAIYRHRQWMKVLYTTAIDPFWRDYLTGFFTQWAEQNLDIDAQKLGIPQEMGTEIIVKWINSLIEIWIVKDEPLPAEEFAQLFLKVTSTPIENFVVSD
ncbi:TetR/AcrR family transcriptional regulator [Streptococcus panodentis]|uniref:TetR/AcrR family transcriptional regulator n=1 Tax=Streptococcus panodentis TaxID=1581472 RepID=A0ABS5B192_9STRE|nr:MULTISPECIES: TetR/AcrR family transcriptional regulator [Streptococcus]MBP2622248.1 TetR/AcrR family transcriptional regulator [Streptococcus panodentis]